MSVTPSRSLLFPSLDKRADAIPAIPAGSRAGPSTAAGCALLNVSLPQNPVYELPLPARVRDPAVALAADGTYELFFTHYHGSVKRMWSDVGGYGVRAVTTRDWRTFSPPLNVTPAGFVSPDAPVHWHGSAWLAYQAYPDKALGGPRSGLFLSRQISAGWHGGRWTLPRPFLEEALDLSWNTAHRAIDPTLIVDGRGRLHCFFVGSMYLLVTAEIGQKPKKANLLGHAVTDDPTLRRWTILSRDAPLLGVSARAPDGVENVAVFPTSRGRYLMIYSEGLAAQHLAHAVSEDDMDTWRDLGPLALPPAAAGGWMAGRYGAPFVWREASGCYWMVLMGEYDVRTHQSAFGLLTSADGERWELLPSKAPAVVEAEEEAVATTAARSVEVEVPPKAEPGGDDDEGDEEGEDDE